MVGFKNWWLQKFCNGVKSLEDRGCKQSKVIDDNFLKTLVEAAVWELADWRKQNYNFKWLKHIKKSKKFDKYVLHDTKQKLKKL